MFQNLKGTNVLPPFVMLVIFLLVLIFVVLYVPQASIGTVCYVAGCRSSDFETMFWEKEVCDQHDVPHASRDCRCEPPYV